MDSKKMKSDKDVKSDAGPSSNKKHKKIPRSFVKLNQPFMFSAPRELKETLKIDYELDESILKEMHSFYIQSGMKVGPSVNSWTNKVLFFKHWINKYRRPCDSHHFFLKIDKWFKVWKNKTYYIYEPSYYPMLVDLWGSCDKSYSDKGAGDYIELGLTNNNVDEKRMKQCSIDLIVLQKMHKFFYTEKKGISTEPVKSSTNITRFYAEEVLGKDMNAREVEQTGFKAYFGILHLYNLFRNFKVDNTTSRIDLEVFYWGFLVWGTDYNGGEFYDIEDDDDDTEGEGEGKGEGG